MHTTDHIEVTEAINTIIKMCSNNIDWYNDYMIGNASRIFADAHFISRQIPKSNNILDIGAIPPLFTELLRRGGFQLCSVADPNPEPFADYFRITGVKSYKIDLLKGVPDEFISRYDVVCLNEVIEHLGGNLLLAIQNAKSCIKPGGYLMITSPNLRSICGLIALVIKSSGLASKPNDNVRAQYDRASAQFGYYGHIREYTKREVIELFTSFGFKLYAYEFQANYIYFGRFTKFATALERMFPEWRLFGKYLFQKIVD
jgi:SAM-dependent methyltransferase